MTTVPGVTNLEEFSVADGHTVEDVCLAVAKAMGVRQHEVALLYLERRMLRFLYPLELKAAGAIPLTSTAVAARTANSKRPELFNNFVTVQHSSIFETIKIGTSDAPSDPLTIQKMMSAPVFGPNKMLLGVIQISRKGYDLRSAGPDFTPADLTQLTQLATTVGRLLPHFIESAT
jgi:hypothetical protein